jgi:hypothetical protein
MKHVPPAVLTVLVVLIGTGCGGGESDTELEASAAVADRGADAPPACDLLTAADVEALYGAPARPTEDLNRDTQCGYWAPETGAQGVTLRLASGPEFRSSWSSDEFRSMSEVQDLTGLGDAAVWVPDWGMLVTLVSDRTHVLAGAGGLDVKRQLMERVLAKE